MGIRRPWCQTSEEANTDTSRLKWQSRITWNRQDSSLWRRTIQATTHRAWGAPNNKRSELKISDKTKHCFEHTPQWTVIWRSGLSRWWNQSSCPYWWTSWWDSDKCRHSPCWNICSPATDWLTRSTLKRTQSRWWGPTTPPNPLPNWLNCWKRGENLHEQEDKKSPTIWWFPKVSLFWNRRGCSAMTSKSGDDNPPTSRPGEIQVVFSPSAPWAENSGKNRRKRGLRRNSAKYLRCTISPSRRAPWGDIIHPKSHAGNARSELRAGRTSIIQFSPYQLKLHGNGTVGTDEWNHELHADAIEDTLICTKPTNQGQKGSTTTAFAGAISLAGGKPDHQRKQDTKMKCTTRKLWVAVKRDVNDS